MRRLSLFERDAAKAQGLAEQLGGLFPQTRIEVLSDDEHLIEALLEAQGLVNATPVGMHVHPGMPLSESALSAGCCVKACGLRMSSTCHKRRSWCTRRVPPGARC